MRAQADEEGTDLVLCQQSGELALLQDDHVLLYSSDLRHHTLKHELLTSETRDNIKALTADKPGLFHNRPLEGKDAGPGSHLT